MNLTPQQARFLIAILNDTDLAGDEFTLAAEIYVELQKASDAA